MTDQQGGQDDRAAGHPDVATTVEPAEPADVKEGADATGGAEGGTGRPELLSVALFLFFIALLLVAAAMTLLPALLR